MCSNCDDGEIRSHWRGCDFVVVRARVLEIDGTMTTRRKRKEREVSSRYLGCSPQAHRSTLRIRIQCGALVSTAGRRELYLPVRHVHVVHKIHSSIYLILGRKSKPFHRLLLLSDRNTMAGPLWLKANTHCGKPSPHKSSRSHTSLPVIIAVRAPVPLWSQPLT